jgi:hypothetical protein
VLADRSPERLLARRRLAPRRRGLALVANTIARRKTAGRE